MLTHECRNCKQHSAEKWDGMQRATLRHNIWNPTQWYSPLCLPNIWSISLGLVLQFYFVSIYKFQIKGKYEAIGLCRTNRTLVRREQKKHECKWLSHETARAGIRCSGSLQRQMLLTIFSWCRPPILKDQDFHNNTEPAEASAKEIFPSTPWIYSPCDITNSTDSVYRHCTVNRFQHCKAWNVCVKFIMLPLPWAD